MDVRQFAFLARQPSAAVKARSNFLGLPKRGLALILANAMFWHPLLAQADGIVVSAPGTTLGQAGNGVPIVNIAAPNANGLSHNQFKDYNVGANGVILNNATDRTQSTQLGGIIVGNPNFNGSAANVILNEVNGGSPSQLRGYTEVAGQSAHVIVANPYGISCNGCGFINTPQATLTTGKAVIENGQVSRYQVDQGSVSIEGAGLNASNIDQFEIITRATTINAQIQAKKLTIVAGRNDVDAHTLSATARASDGSQAPDLAIDSSALGGMYVGAVKLIGTEAGVGVKLSGDMVAGGDIQIDTAGNVVMGQASAGTAIAVKAASVETQGAVYAGTDLAVKTQGTLTNRQTLAAKDSITLDAGGRLTNNGIIEAGVNADNSRNTQGDVRLTAQAIDNSGKTVIASRDLSVNTGELNNQRGTLAAGSALGLTATSLDNTEGKLITDGILTAAIAGQLLNQTGLFAAKGDARLSLGSLDNRQGNLVADNLNLELTGPVNNQRGNLRANTRLDVKAGQVDNSEGGRISSGQSLNASVSSLDQHKDGRLFGQGDVSLDLNGGHLNNQGGVINAPGRLLLSNLNSVDNQDGEISSSQAFILAANTLNNRNAKLLSEQALSVRIAQALDNTKGLIAATGLDLRANSLANAEGELKIRDDVKVFVTTALDNRQGKIVGATVSLNSLALDNSQGLLQGNTLLSVNTSGIAINRGGRFVSGQRMGLNIGQFDNQGGEVSSVSDLSFTGNQLDNSNNGRVLANGAMSLTLDHLDNEKGAVRSDGNLTLHTSTLNNDNGRISSGAAQQLSATGAVSNRNGELLSAMALTVNSASLDNASGKLIGDGAVRVTTGALNNQNSGRLTSADRLDLTAGSVDNRFDGRIASNKSLTASVTGLDQRGAGELYSLSDLSLDMNRGHLNNADGLINAPGQLLLKNLASVDNQNGEISSEQAFTLAAQRVDNSNGQLLSDQTLTLKVERALTNIKGLIYAAALDVQAGSLDNSQAGSLVSDGDLTLKTNDLLDNRAKGRVLAKGAMDIQAQQLDNRGGVLNSKQVLAITSQSLNNQGGLISAVGPVHLNADRVENAKGRIASQDDLVATVGVLNQQGGEFVAQGDLTLNAATLDNRDKGLVAATKALKLNVESIDNRTGELSSQQNLELNGQRLDNSGGKVLAGTTLALAIAEVINQAKGLVSANEVRLTGAHLDNTDGTVGGQRSLALLLSEGLDNTRGTLSSEGAFDLAAQRIDNTGGSLSSAAQLSITSTRDLINKGGIVESAQGLKLTSASLDNTQGLLKSQRETALVTGQFTNGLNGRVISAERLDLTATQVTNSGRIASVGALSANLTGLTQLGGAELLSSAQLTVDLHNGKLVNAGLINAPLLKLNNLAGINNQSGEISSQNAFTLATQNLDNSNGKLISNQALTLRVDQALANVQGLISGRGDVDISASQLIDNQHGSVIADGTLLLGSATLDNRNGAIAGKAQVTVNADRLNNQKGQLISTDGLHITGANLDNREGLVGATKALKLDVGDLDNRAGELTGNADVTVTGQALNNSDNGLVFAGRGLNLAVEQVINRTLGQLNGQRLTLTGTSLDNAGGKLISQQPLMLELAGDLDNSEGLLSSEGSLGVKARSFNNSKGSASSAQGLNVAVTGTLNNQNGALLTDGNLVLRSATLGNQQGSISGKESVSVTSGDLNNQGGRLNSGDTLVLTTAQLNNGGSIGSAKAMSVNVTGLDQQGGKLFSNAGLTLDMNNGRLNNQGGLINATGPLSLDNLTSVTNQKGEISSGQAFTLSAQTLDNTNGKVLSNQGLTLRIEQALTNIKGLIGGGSLNARAAAVDNRGGSLASRGDLQLTSDGLLNNSDQGLINAAQVLTAQSADLNNQNGSLLGAAVTLNASALDNTANGLINSRGTLSLNAARLDTGSGGEVSAKGAMAVGLKALGMAGGRIVGEQGVTVDFNNSDLDNRNGLLLANGPLTLKNLRDLSNQGGEISSQQSFNLAARAVDNTAGKLISSQVLTLNAGSMVNSANGLMSGWQGLNVGGGSLDNRNHGTLSSRNGAINVSLSGALQNNIEGAVVSQGRLDVNAASLDNRGKGVLSSGAGQSLVVTEALVNGDGSLIESGAELAVQAATLANQATINAQQAFTFTGTDLTNNGGTLASNGSLTLDLLGNLNNGGGKLVSAGPLLLQRANQVYNDADGQIASQGLLSLFAKSLDNSERGTIAGKDRVAITTGTVQNHADGLIYSQDADVQLSATSLNNAKGKVQGQTGLSLNIRGDVDNQGGTLASLKGLLDAQLTAGLNNQGGTIQAQRLNLLANSINNQGGRIAAQTGDAVVNANYFANANGGLYAKGLMRVSGQRLDNNAGQIAGGAIDLSASGALTNQGGVIESDSTLGATAGSLDNQGGQLRALGSGGTTNFQLGGMFDNRGGRLETSNVDLTLNAGGFQNQAGSVLHAGNGTFDIATANLIAAGGEVVTRGGLTLAADTWTNSSVIQAGRLTVNVNTLNQLAGGQLLASDRLVGTGDNWTNEGLIASDGTANVTLSGNYGGNGRYSSLGNLGLSAAQLGLGSTASIAAGQDSTINVSGQLNNAGRLTSAGSMRLTAAGVNNTGTLATGANLTLASNALVNSHGLISSGGDMQLLTSSFTNSYADVYGLGDVLIAKDPNQGKADLLDNRSGSIESVKNLTINAMTVNNVRDVLEYSAQEKSSVKITELPCDQIPGAGCDYRGGSRRNGLWQVDEVDRLAITRSTAASALSSGADMQINADTLNNRSSTIAATGALTANASVVNNQGVQAQEIKTTRTFWSFVNEYTQASARVANFNARNATSPSATVESDLAYALGMMWGGQLSRASTTTNSEDSSFDAVIQAGGNVALNAAQKINNSVIRPYYAYVAAGRTKEQTGAGSGYSTAVSINAQLRPDLAQQQVNPIALPGFSLPGGQNGLFRLSGQGAANGQVAQGSAGPQNWSVSGASIDLAQRQQNLPESSARTIQLAEAAQLPVSPREVSVAARNAGGIDAAARAANTSADTAAVLPGATFLPGITRVEGISAENLTAAPAVNGLTPLARDPRAGMTSASTAPSQNVPGSSAQTLNRVQGLPDSKAVSQPHKYLIETNPVLTDLKQFMSSDYLLAGLGYNPDQSAKRLGDGFYEQRLIQQAVVARTGQRFIDGQTSDEKLFKHLMDNAIASKQELNLAVGVSLSSEQVAALTHDIVWLEKSVVNGEEVLVPVLYLANANNRLAPTGALIAGSDVSLIAGQDLNNVGTLRASNNLSAKAGNDLINSGLIEAGNRLDLLAGNTIVNKAGGIIAGRDVTMTAVSGDVINERTVTAHDSSDGVISEHTDFLNTAARIEAGNDLGIKAGRDFSNQGSVLQSGRDTTIQAGRDLSFGSVEQANSNANISARNNSSSVTQNGSSVTVGRDLKAVAGRDLAVIASQVDAKRDVAMSAVGNLILASAADEQHSALNLKKVKAQEDHVRQVSTSVKAGGDVTLSAGKDLAMIASRVAAGDEAYLVAGNNLELKSAEDQDYSFYSKTKKTSSGKKSRLDETESIANVGSLISSGGNSTLVAGENLLLAGSAVTAEKGAAKLVAGKDVEILAMTDSNSARHERKESKSSWGGFKSSKVEDQVDEKRTTAVGSMVSGDTVSVAGGQDVKVTGSALVSSGDLAVEAGRDLTIDAAQNTFSRTDMHKEKNRDLTGVLTGNKLGLDDMTGNQHLFINSQKYNGTAAETTLTGSTVGSSAGNVKLEAGRELKVVASDVVSIKDMDLKGSNVTIAAGMETASQSTVDKSKSLAVGRVIGGAVVDTARSIRDGIETAKNSDDPRLKAVKLAQIALNTYNLGGQITDANGQSTGFKDKQGGTAGNGSLIKIGTELANTSSKNTSEYRSETAKQSTLNAGQGLSVVATGKVAETQGDIHVIGSALKAANTALVAKNDIILESAQNTTERKNDSKNNKTSIGASFNIGEQNGFTLDLGAQIAKGLGSGSSATQLNSKLDTGALVLISGQDTTLAGAQVRADSIKADIGGDLNVASRQDTDTQKSKQGSAGVGASICVPPFCYGSTVTASANISAGNMNSDYKAVTDQTGLYSGKGGYDISVGKTTTLQGAVIASDAAADKNYLNTDRLLTSDIKNTSKITSTSANAGISGGASGLVMGPPMGAVLSESDSSKTRAAVSEGTIVVRNPEGANDLVGLNRDTQNANKHLDKPDEKAMRERMDLINSSAELARTIGSTIAKAKIDEAADPNTDAGKAARQKLLERGVSEPTPEQVKQQAEKDYGIGSSFQRTTQTVTAIVQGIAGGNLGAAIAGTAAPYLAQKVKDLTQDDDAANLMAHAVLGAVLARAGGNSALVGASGAVAAEATARLIRNQLYGDVSDDDLTSEQKQTISALSTLAAGIAGSAVGKDALSAVAAAQVGKNAVENNQLSAKDVIDLQTELANANKNGEPTEAIWEKYKKLSAEKRAEMLAGCAGKGGLCSLGYQSEYEGGIQTADSVSSLRWFFGLSEADASRLKEFVTEENQNDMGLLYNALPTWEKAALIGKEVLTASGASIGRDKTSVASIVGKGKGGAGTQGGGAKGIQATEAALQVPGRVQSRVNLRNGSQAEGAGWNHLTNEHYSAVKNKSQFTVPQDELRQILQSKEVVSTPVTKVLPSADGPRFVREVDVGKNIGTDKFNNFSPTTKMSVLTDEAGNLVSAFPGVLK